MALVALPVTLKANSSLATITRLQTVLTKLSPPTLPTRLKTVRAYHTPTFLARVHHISFSVSYLAG